MNNVTLTDIKRLNSTEGRCNGDYDNDCLPEGMTTDELTEAEYSPYDDGDSPYHVMKDPYSDMDGYSPEFNYKDHSKLIGEHIDEDTGFTVTDEVSVVSRVEDEPLPYDDWNSSDIDDDDGTLFYEDIRL